MSQKALTCHEAESSVLKPVFNDEAKTCEYEIKFLGPRMPDGAINTQTFQDIKKYFQNKGWIRSSQEVLDPSFRTINKDGGALLSRQLDTPDFALQKIGTSVRIRGLCPDGNINHVTRADICVKFGKVQDETGALIRSEFETKIASFDKIDFAPLFKKFPRSNYPELYQALEAVVPRKMKHLPLEDALAKLLVEIHRPDVLRNRHIIEFPEEATGLKGKKFFIELLLDESRFVFDPQPFKNRTYLGHMPKTGPILYHVDMEAEAEPLFKPCLYDRDPHATDYVSSPMSNEERKQAMGAVAKHLQLAAGNTLIPNKFSKAERGSYYFQKEYGGLKDYIELNTPSRKGCIRSMFKLKAENDRIHHHLSQDYGPYLRESPPIASYV